MKKLIVIIVAFAAFGIAACDSAADVTSQNLSQAAENFEIQRRIVFYNGITDSYALSIEGRCSIEDYTTQLAVTCKVSDTEYLKHYLGRSDNMTYFVEQMQGADVSEYQYRVFFRPTQIVPDVSPQVP